MQICVDVGLDYATKPRVHLPHPLIERRFRSLCMSRVRHGVPVLVVAIELQQAPCTKAGLILTRSVTAELTNQQGTVISPYLFFWQSAEQVEETKR
jgi:hypothetical protein